MLGLQVVVEDDRLDPVSQVLLHRLVLHAEGHSARLVDPHRPQGGRGDEDTDPARVERPVAVEEARRVGQVEQGGHRDVDVDGDRAWQGHAEAAQHQLVGPDRVARRGVREGAVSGCRVLRGPGTDRRLRVGRRVGVGAYSARRVIAYVEPH